MFSTAIRYSAMLCALASATGCAADVGSESDLGAAQEEGRVIENGLMTINGLTALNGLITINGLTSVNGLMTINGLVTINGLTTMNGLATINGMSVDCTGKTLGTSCTGVANGLLSATTGLLKSAQAKTTAQYLVRCALPAGQAITLKDYTGGLTTLTGELGLVPTWLSNGCDGTCQEKISACLMSLTNGSGDHVNIELRSTMSGIGQGGAYRYQEAAFYGNVFASPPKAYYCIGKDFEGLLGTTIVGSPEQRACSGFSALGISCPYQKAGLCNRGWGAPLPLGKAACAFSGDSATACSTAGSLAFSNYNNGDRKWKNAITTYRSSK